MRTIITLILLAFFTACGSKVSSYQDVESQLCDRTLYQLIEAGKTHVSAETYMLLKIDCKAHTMTMTQIIANQKVKEQTTPIKLSIPEGVITLLDEAGNINNKLLNTDFPHETLYFYIPQPALLRVDTGEEEMLFQKFQLTSHPLE